MEKDFLFYAKRFAKLRVDKARGTAPHKPILLLTVLDLLNRNRISRNEIYLSPELTANFLKFWHRFVDSDHHSNIALPFFHLTGDKFWHLMPNPGFEAAIQAKVKLRSLPVLRSAVKYAYFDNELFAILKNEKNRLELTSILIQIWFPNKGEKIEEAFSYDEFEVIQQSLFESGGAVYSVEDLKDEDRVFTRNGAFRRNISRLYEQRCAFCKIRVISEDGQNLVDGAHIKPFSEFRNDLFSNGLALCKNHHWAFDRGWFSIDENYRIIVPNNRFEEEPPRQSLKIEDFHQEEILLPNDNHYLPSIESLQWHRENWGIVA